MEHLGQVFHIKSIAIFFFKSKVCFYSAFLIHIVPRATIFESYLLPKATVKFC